MTEPTYTLTQSQIADLDQCIEQEFSDHPLLNMLRALTPNSGEPFGIWHPAEDPDECEFFLHSESGAVSCPNCILLFTHSAPSTKPAEGWKLVPVTPTHEMLMAAFKVAEDSDNLTAMNCYNVMLAAAPQGDSNGTN